MPSLRWEIGDVTGHEVKIEEWLPKPPHWGNRFVVKLEVEERTGELDETSRELRSLRFGRTEGRELLAYNRLRYTVHTVARQLGIILSRVSEAEKNKRRELNVRERRTSGTRNLREKASQSIEVVDNGLNTRREDCSVNLGDQKLQSERRVL